VPSDRLFFEWDNRKNAQNKRKHGISFEEAQTVFLDENALLISDPDIQTTRNVSFSLG
jgi:uncharacterized DUF497 family protein